MTVLLTAAVAAALLSACGGGSSSDSGNATALLRQTFTGRHGVKSGVLGIDLTLSAASSGQRRKGRGFGVALGVAAS